MAGTESRGRGPRSSDDAALTRNLWRPLFAVVIQAVALCAGAGSLTWAAGWVYVGLYLGVIVVGAVLLTAHDPDLMRDRGQGSPGGEQWDVRLTRVLGLALLAVLATAGLDERLDWSPALPMPLRVAGAVVVVVGYGITLWAMYVNTFFTVTVRIQPERGHVVVTDGPYAYVRHPGYAGMTVAAFAATFLLGSLWALVPWAVMTALTVVRVVLEERTLTRHLTGYTEYAARTRYRLLPLVW
jgi:protein-S-isoprenylcysteine O-methyltransferase Ste14